LPALISMMMCVGWLELLDAECEKTMSVLVDNVETLVHFIDVDIASQQVSSSIRDTIRYDKVRYEMLFLRALESRHESA